MVVQGPLVMILSTTDGRVGCADYKVRIIDGHQGTGAKTRVHIESTDGARHWSTVGVSYNIIDASWKALMDSIEYCLLA